MKRIVYVCFFALMCASCSTTESNQEQSNPESNFYALTVGNSWVYKNYEFNSTTQGYDDTGVVDSISIVGTEELNGNTYFNFRRWTVGNEDSIAFCNPNGEHFELLRDSLGYLIRDNGSVKYAHNDFVPRPLNSMSWGTVYEQLIATDHEITVEAGAFNSTYTQRFAILSNGDLSNGLDHIYYADGIGLIYDTSSFVFEDTPRIVRRLESYNIED